MAIRFVPVGVPFNEIGRVVDAFMRPTQSEVAPVEEAIRLGIAENFRTESAGGHTWTPLAPATVRERVRRGYGGFHPMLVRSAALWQTYTNANNPRHASELAQGAGGWTLAVGSDDIRATTHEFGRDHIPARPVLILSDAQEGRVLDALGAMLTAIERRIT